MQPQLGTWTLGDSTLAVTEITETTVTFGGNTVPTERYLALAAETAKRGALFTPTMKPITGSSNIHARLSPSSSKQWTQCTASIAYIEANRHRVPRDTGSVWADEGTQAHEVAANVLLGNTVNDVPEPVAAYVEHCRSLVPEGVAPLVEFVVPLFYQPGETGTCDFAIVTDGRITVRDYKHGMGVLVESAENTQLAIYAYSLVRMLDDGDIYTFTEDTVVDIMVFQPRHREAHTSEPWITTLGELRKFCEAIEYAAIQGRTALERCQSRITGFGTRDISPEEILEAAPGVRFAPQEGDDGACRWCKAKGFCARRMTAAAEAFDIESMPGTDLIAAMPDLTKEEKALPVEDRVAARFDKMGVPAEALTDEYFVRVVAAKKWIESCLDDVTEMMENRLLDGQDIPGVKLVLGRAGNRAWVNEEAADAFLKNQKLKESERYDFKLKSPTVIEKVLHEKLSKVTRTRNLFDSLVTRSEPKKTLALASDKREAVAAAITLMPDIAAVEGYEV